MFLPDFPLPINTLQLLHAPLSVTAGVRDNPDQAASWGGFISEPALVWLQSKEANVLDR
jgi:hypothetical protein